MWKIRKRCQGSGSRAKYLAAKKFPFKFLVLSDCVGGMTRTVHAHFIISFSET